NIGAHGHAQSGHAERQHDKRLHGALLANELDPLLQAGEHRLGGTYRQESACDQQERNDGRQKRKRVQAEAPLLAQLRQSDAGERGTDGYRQVELNRIQRNGVWHVLPLYQRGNQRRVRWTAKSLREAGHKRQAEDGPDVSQSVGDQNGKDRRACHLYVLGGEQDFAPLDAVGHHPADQREQKNRDAAQKLVEREQES